MMLRDNAKMLHPKPNLNTVSSGGASYVAKPLAVIIVPTRELAVQIGEETARLSYRTPVRYCLAYGGAPKRTQLEDLKCGCDILIGTPGRLMDLAEKHENVVDFGSVRWVLQFSANLNDELTINTASLSSMRPTRWSRKTGRTTWTPSLRVSTSQSIAPRLLQLTLLVGCSDNAQFMMFSATFKQENRELAKAYMGPDRMAMYTSHWGSSHANIHQVVFPCHTGLRRQCLVDLLLSLPSCRTIIFVNTQRGVDELDDFLYNNKFPCTAVHSGRTQREREDSV